MLCQHCGKNEATTHVKSIINGEYTEYMLCPECAKEMGYTSIWSDMQNDFNTLLGSFFSNALPERSQATRCPKCKSTYNDIVKSGQVGCANCYETFYSELMPTIRRIHGNTNHNGKRPGFIGSTSQAPLQNEVNDTASKIEKLRAELDEAIKEQNFETAAELRDKIKELEESK